jgi:hypothetical protein
MYFFLMGGTDKHFRQAQAQREPYWTGFGSTKIWEE